MRLDALELDEAKLAGIWWDYTTGAPCPGNKPHERNGCFLIVPHIGSGFDAVLMEEQQPYLEMLRRKPSEEDREAHSKMVADMLVKTRARAVARTVLRGWANWERPDGTPLDYSEEEAALLLGHRRWLALARFVETCSLNTDAARAREEAQAAGN